MPMFFLHAKEKSKVVTVKMCCLLNLWEKIELDSCYFYCLPEDRKESKTRDFITALPAYGP